MSQFNRAILPNESRSEWSSRFYSAAVATGRVFRTVGDDNILIKPKTGLPRRIITPEQFMGSLGEIVDIIERRGHADAQHAVTVALERDEVLMLYNSESRARLPAVHAIVYEPVCVPTESGRYEVVNPGYNPRTGVYYHVDAGEPPLEPVEGVEYLKKCFSAAPFESPGHFSNLIAWLLGGVVLDPTIDPPLLVVSGNQQGIGKSSIVQAAGTIITGIPPNPISPHGSEFSKQVSAQFAENSRFLFVDNIVVKGTGTYDNSHLSTLLTQGFTKKVRILGHSRSVSSSGVLIAASLNDAKFSTDLATRSLPVKLYSWVNRLMSPYCKHFAVEYRRRLYGELLWLALQGVDDPPADDRHLAFRFRRWLAFTRPRVEAYFPALAVDSCGALDEIEQELHEFGLDAEKLLAGAALSFTVEEFVHCVGCHQQYAALNQKLSSITSETRRKDAFGRMLSCKVDHPITIEGSRYVTIKRVTDGHYTFVVQEQKP